MVIAASGSKEEEGRDEDPANVAFNEVERVRNCCCLRLATSDLEVGCEDD